MRIRLGYDIEITCDQPTPLVTLLDPRPEWQGRILDSTGITLSPDLPARPFIDGFGNHGLRLMAPAGRLTLYRDSLIEVDPRPEPWEPRALEPSVDDIPDEVLVYLLPSRYCDVDLMLEPAWEWFGKIPAGWDRVRAVFDHVSSRLTFGYPHARATRTASEAWREGKGVCRDFAHLAITLCRCLNIPARYVNGYLGDIGVPPDPAPMDFNAWCEVWLGGEWVTFDARHNMPRIGRVPVAYGRDAADVALLHSFGPHELTRFKVWTDEA